MRNIIVCCSIGLFFSFCGAKGPEPIHYGVDMCSFCKMTITEKKFGAEIITAKGKIYKFDSYECMNDFLKIASNSDMQAEKKFLTDYFSGKLIAASSCFLVKSDSIKSPMGGDMAACETQSDAEKLAKETSGTIIQFTESAK